MIDRKLRVAIPAARNFLRYMRWGSQLVTNGGRVLGVTATAPGLPRAISIAYEAAEHIHFDKLHKRTDIGMRALKALAEKE